MEEQPIRKKKLPSDWHFRGPSSHTFILRADLYPDDVSISSFLIVVA
jgi:hypothetical protein